MICFPSLWEYTKQKTEAKSAYIQLLLKLTGNVAWMEGVEYGTMYPVNSHSEMFLGGHPKWMDTKLWLSVIMDLNFMVQAEVLECKHVFHKQRWWNKNFRSLSVRLKYLFRSSWRGNLWIRLNMHVFWWPIDCRRKFLCKKI